MRKSRFSHETLSKIVEDYNADILSNIEIEQKYGMGQNTLRKLLRKLNVPMKLGRISEEQTSQIIKSYLDGKSSEQIAIEVGFDSTSILRILKRNNIATRPATQNKRRYTLNEKLFENINDETSAYFLGLMYADGSVSKKSNGCSVLLKKDDEDILFKFSDILYNTNRVKQEIRDVFNKKTNELETRVYSRFSFYSEKMHKDLVDKGCVPNKTFKIRFNDVLNFIPDHLLHHFIRGYFDGDGCISITDIDTPRVDFTSNIHFVKELAHFLHNKLGVRSYISLPKKNKNPDTRSLQVNHNRAEKILSYMYKDATHFINRKKTKYDILMEHRGEKELKTKDKYSDISNYGTTYIPIINGNRLTSKHVASIKEEDIDDTIDKVFNFYRENGFPYVKLSNDTLIKDFVNIQKSDMSRVCKVENDIKYVNISNKNGNEIFKHFSPHFYEINASSGKMLPSFIDAFNDDAALKKCIKNRLTRNEAPPGEDKRHYNINGSSIRKGLESARLAFKASIFNTVLAKYIYETFTKEGDIVYDYSMGFGQRLLGALATDHNITYVGTDPCKKTYDSNCEIFKFFSEKIPGLNKNVDLYNLGSEYFCEEKYAGKVSLAFSSPPYFDLEVYENNNSQAYNAKDGSGASYDYFINTYWRKTMKNIDAVLKEDGVFILNIKDVVKGFDIGNHMLTIAKEFGFEVFDKYHMVLSLNSKFRTNGKNNANKLEPIYCLKRIKKDAG